MRALVAHTLTFPKRLALLLVLLLACMSGFPAPALDQTPVVTEADENTRILRSLTAERQMLTLELDEYRKSLMLLHSGPARPEESPNSVVRKLAQEMVNVKKRLVQVTEREINLLQTQLLASDPQQVSIPALSSDNTAPTAEPNPDSGRQASTPRDAYSLELESVERLRGLLASYYAELEEAAKVLPTEEEVALRAQAQRDAESLARIPFSRGKVRLNGAEGSTALAQITQRLMDPRVPESRRDIAPICTIKTRLLDTLVGSERRSLRPVGKHHYIARVRLQPGDTTLNVQSNRWQVSLPHHANAQDFLITMYRPPDSDAELHVFAIEDLLSASDPHIPAWLPDDLDLSPTTG